MLTCLCCLPRPASDAPQLEREKGAALRLQCWQRLVTSKKLLSLLIVNKKMREVQERNAAKQIQQVNKSDAKPSRSAGKLWPWPRKGKTYAINLFQHIENSL